jgi:hypothetical protein
VHFALLPQDVRRQASRQLPWWQTSGFEQSWLVRHCGCSCTKNKQLKCQKQETKQTSTKERASTSSQKMPTKQKDRITFWALSTSIYHSTIWTNACNRPAGLRINHNTTLIILARIIGSTWILAGFCNTSQLRGTVLVNSALRLLWDHS